MDYGKKIVLFGAGQIGKRALQYFGRSRVCYFVDNNEGLVGKRICDIPVISFRYLKGIYGNNLQIIISTSLNKVFPIARQLEDAGIKHYEVFIKILWGESGVSTKQATEITIQNQPALNLEGKNRVLMVAYYFPPVSGSGVFRSAKFAKYLPQYGWHPTIIATDYPRLDWNYMDESLLKEIPTEVPVIRIPDTIGTFREIFTPELKKQLMEFLEIFFQESKEAYTQYTSFLESKIGIEELLTFPCPALLWAYRTVQYIEATMNISNFHVIYTTSGPSCAHLIGYYFKHKYRIPWVADYRDQWTGNPFGPFDPSMPHDQLLFSLESILLQNADYNITFAPGIIEDYISRFQLPREKIASITNGYDEDDFAPFDKKVGQTDKFTINYSGLLYVGRSIDAVLVAIQELIAEGQVDLAKVEFRIVGETREYDPEMLAQKYDLKSVIVQTGYLTHSEAIRSNIESNLLLLLVGDEKRYQHITTGKIFDYLRSGRPILALAPPGGIVDQMLCETGHGKAFTSTQISEIKAMILQEYLKWKRGKDCGFSCSPLIKQFERKYLTEKLVQVFENIQRKGSI